MNKEQLEQLASLLNQEAEEVMSDLYTTDSEGKEQLKEGVQLPELIKGWAQAEVRRVGESQRKRGIKEASQRWERNLQELAGDSGLKGDELLSAVREKIETAGSDNSDELTPDTIRKHPAYKDALKADSRQLVEERDNALKQLEETKTEFQRKATKQQVIARAFEELDKARVKWGEDEETKQARKQTIKRLLESDIDRLRMDGDNIVVLDAEGNPAQDKDYKDVTFDKYVRDLGKTFGFHKYDPDKGGPEPKPGAREGQPAKPGEFRVTNDQEYAQLLRKHPGKQAEITQAYKAFVAEQSEK